MQTPELPIEVNVHEVSQIKEGGEVLLLDCRENDEYAICQIEGAKLLPMNETPTRIGELEEFKDGRIVVFCHGGVRSLRVASWLRGNGFPQAQSMIGVFVCIA